MASLRFDAAKPSHIVGVVALLGIAVFLVVKLATDPDVLAATILRSLALGSIYAIIALGFVLIFKATEVVNFSQGALAMAGALFVSFMVADKNLPIIGFFTEVSNPIYEVGLPDSIAWAISVLVALVFAAGLGLLIERIAIRPMIGEPLFSVAVITLGLEIVLRVFSTDSVKIQFRNVQSPWGVGGFKIGAGDVRWAYFAAMLTAAVAFVAVFFFYRSRMGIAMRAVAHDQEAAMAQGISIGKVFAIAWGAGAVLAAIGGIFATQPPISEINGVDAATAAVAFRALPAVILGGLDSVQGALIGGLLVGTAEIFAGQYLASWTGTLGPGYSLIVPYVVMIITLLVRPYGLFGTPEIRRV